MSCCFLTNQKEVNPNYILSAQTTNRELQLLLTPSVGPCDMIMPAKTIFHRIVTKHLPIKFYIKQTQELLLAGTRAWLRLEQRKNKAPMATVKKKRKGGKTQFFNSTLCWKGAGHDKKKPIWAAGKYKKSLSPTHFLDSLHLRKH